MTQKHYYGYICDNCKKEIKNTEKPPEGWFTFYGNIFKSTGTKGQSKNIIFEIDACSSECFINLIKKKIE